MCSNIATTGLPGYSFARDRLDETISLPESASGCCTLNATNGKFV